MDRYKPSFGKIVLTPSIFLALLLFVGFLITNFFSDFRIDNVIILGIGLLLLLIISYIPSSIIWELGKNHRRIRIVVTTLVTALAAFFILSLIISFFGLCISDLGLPCGGDLGPCPAPRPCPQPPLSYLAIVLPIVILIVGLVKFLKEGKKKTSGKM